MATNLTQSQQLSQIPGSAGQQSVVQDRSPTLGEGLQRLTKAATNAYDAAGTIYAKNRSEEIVNEELGNIEQSIAIAERMRDDEDFVRPDLLPTSDPEFDLIHGAVLNGSMTREKARLIASSRLRTRISEQPFFADKLRQAASEVVGFNIQSEPARQYFASFQTEAQLRSGSAKTQQQKWMDEAQAISVTMPGVPVEEIYRQLAQASYAETRKQFAANRKELGLIDDMEEFNEVNAENSAIDFGSILGNFKQIFEQNGSVDEQAATQILSQAKAARMAELDQIFQDQTSTEYQRAQQAIESRFQNYADFVESVGFDTLNQLRIDRVKRANEILGDKLWPMEKLIVQNLGSDTFTQTLELISSVTDPSRLETVFRSSPITGKVAAILGNKTAMKSFGDQIAEAYGNIAQGNQPQDNTPNQETGMTDTEVTEAILQKMFQDGGSSEEGAVEYMNQNGLNTKAVSMISQKAPGRASEGSKEYFKTMYNSTLPQFTERLGQVLAANPNLEWNINENGEFIIQQPQPNPEARGGRAMQEDIRRVQREMRGYNQAQELATHINLYGQGIAKGWGNVVGTTPAEYRKRVADMADGGFVRQQQIIVNEAVNLVLEGDSEAARIEFDKLQRLDDKYKGFTFEQWQESTRRLNNL